MTESPFDRYAEELQVDEMDDLGDCVGWRDGRIADIAILILSGFLITVAAGMCFPHVAACVLGGH